MTNSKPRVSIGLPVYNGEPYIKQALDSILAQTYTNFELIISDNASTDGTEEICRAYTAKDSRIHHFRNEANLGAAMNFNRTFELSKGEYFKWAAADDLCAPTFLSKCVEVLDRFPGTVLCYTKTLIIDENGIAFKEYDNHLDLSFPSVRSRFREAIYKLGECNAVFGLIRSNVLRKTSLIENYIASDVVLLGELTLFGKFYEITEHLFFRRQHARASSSNKSIESKQEFFDPTTKGDLVYRTWNLMSRHLRNVIRSPLNCTDKLYLVCMVLRLYITCRDALIQELLGLYRHVIAATIGRHETGQ